MASYGRTISNLIGGTGVVCVPPTMVYIRSKTLHRILNEIVDHESYVNNYTRVLRLYKAYIMDHVKLTGMSTRGMSDIHNLFQASCISFLKEDVAYAIVYLEECFDVLNLEESIKSSNASCEGLFVGSIQVA